MMTLDQRQYAATRCWDGQKLLGSEVDGHDFHVWVVQQVLHGPVDIAFWFAWLRLEQACEWLFSVGLVVHAVQHRDDFVTSQAVDMLKVIDGLPDHVGAVNVASDVIQAQIASSIRRGHTQVRQQPAQPTRVCLVGGGPSLRDTEHELVELIHEGAKLVTVNAAYQWCLSRNLKPDAQIVLDARACNARFVDPPVPGCKYMLASQCHPETWERVEGRPHVWIWHALNPVEDGSERCVEQGLLDTYYLKHWHGVAGGTTVMMRALMLLRVLGYLRFDLFGCDSCFMDDQHHAYAQPENDRDKRLRCEVEPTDRPDLVRTFICAPWMAKQAEDFLQTIRFNGQHFLLNVHGDGLLAYMMRTCAGGASISATDDQ